MISSSFRPAGTLLAIATSATLHATTAVAGTTCTVKFLVPDHGQNLGALSFNVNYAGSNTFINGVGYTAQCSGTPFNFMAANDIEGSSLLRLSFVATQTNSVATPAYVGECTTSGADAADPDSYALSFVDNLGSAQAGLSGTGICGAPYTGQLPPKARDAYTALNRAVSLNTCPLCECDVDNTGSVNASDALKILYSSVEAGPALVCPGACSPTSGFSGSQFVGIDAQVICNGVGCGNGIIDGSDECDDGDPDDADACPNDCAVACPTTPRGDCRAAGLSKILIKGDGSGEKDKLMWTWAKGPEVLYANIPNPTVSGNSYQLCLYPNGVLLQEAELPGPLGWTAKEPKSFTYADKVGAQYGVQKLQIAAGAAGKSKVKLKAGGASLPPGLLPVTNWTIQLFDNAGGSCWSSSFASPTLNDGTIFKASNP